MPTSDSCTVRHSRSTDREARASTAMTQLGWSLSTTAWTSTPLSTPVVPSTPAARAATARRWENWGRASTRCRVTRVKSTALGPTRSGVMARLPSPTTRASPFVGSMGVNSPATASTARENPASSLLSNPSSSTVT